MTIETKTSAGRLVTLVVALVFALTIGVVIGRTVGAEPTVAVPIVTDQQLKTAHDLVEARTANRIYLATIHHMQATIDELFADRQLLLQTLVGMPTTKSKP